MYADLLSFLNKNQMSTVTSTMMIREINGKLGIRRSSKLKMRKDLLLFLNLNSDSIV